MAKPDIRNRLAQGAPLVLDGATGSELQRRGVWVSHGATADKLGAWSATAMRDAPDVVREVHEDYFKVGADIVTTNSFWTNSVKLGLVASTTRRRSIRGAPARLPSKRATACGRRLMSPAAWHRLTALGCLSIP